MPPRAFREDVAFGIRTLLVCRAIELGKPPLAGVIRHRRIRYPGTPRYMPHNTTHTPCVNKPGKNENKSGQLSARARNVRVAVAFVVFVAGGTTDSSVCFQLRPYSAKWLVPLHTTSLLHFSFRENSPQGGWGLGFTEKFFFQVKYVPGSIPTIFSKLGQRLCSPRRCRCRLCRLCHRPYRCTPIGQPIRGGLV